MEVRFTSQVLKNSNKGNVALTSLQLFISRTHTGLYPHTTISAGKVKCSCDQQNINATVGIHIL